MTNLNPKRVRGHVPTCFCSKPGQNQFVVPRLSDDGKRLIWVCNDPDCVATLEISIKKIESAIPRYF